MNKGATGQVWARYARHQEDCKAMPYGVPCSCGLDDLLSALAAPLTTDEISARSAMPIAPLPHAGVTDRKSSWQPIASAPQDGRWVLVWAEDLEYAVYRFGPGLIDEEEPDWTHWMALPPPPKE